MGLDRQGHLVRVASWWPAACCTNACLGSCRAREVQQPIGIKPEDLLEQNRYLSPKSLVNAIYNSDRTLQEWTVSLYYFSTRWMRLKRCIRHGITAYQEQSRGIRRTVRTDAVLFKTCQIQLPTRNLARSEAAQESPDNEWFGCGY